MAEVQPDARPEGGSPILALEEVRAGYGRIEVIHGLTLALAPGEFACIVGGNGAGKTTLLKVIAGALPPRRGEIILAGQRVTGLGPERMVARGVALCPEGRQLFPRMTVRENLEMGAFTHPERAEELLEHVLLLFPRLKERLRQTAGSLSGGEQQMAAIGRALMSDPRLLLLDEPSLGLAPAVVETVASTLERLHAEGRTILLVEQDVEMAFSLAGRGYVLENGRVTAEGDVRVLRETPDVQAAYLGGAAG